MANEMLQGNMLQVDGPLTAHCIMGPGQASSLSVMWVLCPSYLWRIPLTWRTSQGHSGSVWLNNKEETFELPQLLNTSALDWIKLNLNETAYVRVNYKQSNWRALTNALQREHTVQIWLSITSFS